jgi:hypothetical protein
MPVAPLLASREPAPVQIVEVGGKLVTRQEVKARAAGPWAADIKL